MEIKLTDASNEIGKKIYERTGGKLSGKKYVTFDISTSGTGWAFWKLRKNGTAVYQDGGVIRPNGETAMDRFPEMASGIIKVISGKVPDFIVSEQMFIRKSFDSIEYPLKLHGIEEYAANMADILDVPIVTSTWRSLCGFKSNLQIGTDANMTKKEKDAYYKTSSMNLASNVTNVQITDDNHADSICIGYATSLILQNYVQNAQKPNGKSQKSGKSNEKITRKKKKRKNDHF